MKNGKAYGRIEKNIPVPNEGRGGVKKYPWDSIKVGESFLTRYAKASGIGPSRSWWEAKTGYKYTVKQCDDGVRVWRVA